MQDNELVRRWFVSLCLMAISFEAATAAERVLQREMKHLRNAEPREWNEFAEQAEGSELVVPFTVDDSFQPQTLRLRHRDLKQLWRVYVDDQEIAQLPRDENSMVTFWSLPADKLTVGEHHLRIASKDKTPDDVLIGDLRLIDLPREKILQECAVDLTVNVAGGGPVPCRITVVDDAGSLMTTGFVSDSHLAIRPGVVYSSDGHARLALAAGKYTVYAGRGFEYSVASVEVSLYPGQSVQRQLTLTREVDTAGWVACDTHVHTLKFSGHGDSTIDERMITLAGEGIELPIATDHNVQIDYEAHARKLNVRSFFTPVVGNEVTTKVGHFNVFPLSASMPVIDYRGGDWRAVGEAIHAVADRPIVILNHARDLHSGFRPFDPKRHIAIAGEDREGWQLPAGAMEVVNSGATQTDPLRLFHDWMGLLNRGLSIAPIGSSDSHDVARHFVGQGRTYIQVDDRDPGKIDIAAACKSLREGRVMAGSGLVCRAQLNGQFGPGDLVSKADHYQLDVEVLGPSWVKASEVRLYVNGKQFVKEEVPTSLAGFVGVRWRGTWKLPKFLHDSHVISLAMGPGVKELFWPVAKPYQPASPDERSYVVGCCGVIRIDADGDGKYSSPLDYAQRLVDAAKGNMPKLVGELQKYDEAVAVQAASIVHARGAAQFDALVQAAMADDSGWVKPGVQAYSAAWREGLAEADAPFKKP